VGVVGAGQLARMMGDEAHDVGVTLAVLATSMQDSAITTTDVAIVGAPDDPHALRDLARVSDVITFDHELVDLGQIDHLELDGVKVRPGAGALAFSVDKAHQRTEFAEAGLRVPRFLVTSSSADPEVARFINIVGLPVVKAARGGYDGRGVLFPSSRRETFSMINEVAATSLVVLEERLELRGELAQVVVRDVFGTIVSYPLVDTVQADGMCIEVRFPAAVSDDIVAQARELGERISELVDAVGVIAVEFFLVDDGLVINEIALRPHNSGHWTIEGARTSQFANHLLAVSGQRVRATDPIVAAAVMVNVVGAEQPGSLDDARAVPGVTVHDYGKSWRPARKLGHVTATGDDASLAHVTAWKGALAYGTRTRET
jgi:5-(carboxyamino)imidazole ribonucleotide synthase